MLRPTYRHATRQLRTPLRSAALGKRYLHAPVKFDWQDPLNTSNLFTEEEQAISETAESYCQERMLPRVLGTYTVVGSLELADVLQMHTAMRTLIGRSSRKWAN